MTLNTNIDTNVSSGSAGGDSLPLLLRKPGRKTVLWSSRLPGGELSPMIIKPSVMQHLACHLIEQYIIYTLLKWFSLEFWLVTSEMLWKTVKECETWTPCRLTMNFLFKFKYHSLSQWLPCWGKTSNFCSQVGVAVGFAIIFPLVLLTYLAEGNILVFVSFSISSKQNHNHKGSPFIVLLCFPSKSSE